MSIALALIPLIVALVLPLLLRRAQLQGYRDASKMLHRVRSSDSTREAAVR